MPRNYFVTGLPKSGKTTLLKKLVDELKKQGKKVGGFLTPEQKEHGTRESFLIQDIETKKSGILAVVGGNGPRVGKYAVNLKDFEGIAIPSMKKVDEYDVFVIDEIGKMEMKSKKFIKALDKVFESNTAVIASIAEDFAATYAHQGETFLLTPINREGVYLELLHNATKIEAEKVAAPYVVSAVAREKRSKKESTKKKKRAAKKEKPSPPKKNKKEEKGIFSKIKKLIGV